MNKAATLSSCGKHRFSLIRNWGDGETATFIMLNPSTADHIKDDPTIQRCIKFSQKWGCGTLRVVNLFSLRTSSPKEMMAASEVPAMDEWNQIVIKQALEKSHPSRIICAWGNNGAFKDRDLKMMKFMRDFGFSTHCLGTTESGQPKHPLSRGKGFIPYDFEPVWYAGKKIMKILVACEFSGIVRDAFLERGHDAWSCDLLPTETNSNRHIQGDVREVLQWGWDMLMVAHPPCTRLCNSGVRWLANPPPGKTVDDMQRELREGAELFSDCWNAPIEKICIENPVMHKHAKALIRNFTDFTQSVQPWQFGHGEVKRTCFWLKNLPPLVPTDIVEGRVAKVHRMAPGKNRQKSVPDSFPALQRQWRNNGDDA